MQPDLETRARAWMAADPDPETRAETDDLLRRGDRDGLAERFGRSLGFGTAGLRARLGAGPNRMNRLVVRLASRGLAAELPPWARVVVGHDARIRSSDFAHDAAGVLAAEGIEALLLPPRVPTPVLAFAIRHLGADAGVMVTASHNPRDDNGYKVFLGDGAQVLPPVDERIAAAIDPAPAAPVPVAPDGDARIVRLGDEVVDAYVDWAAGTAPAGPRRVRIVHTALHGVGWPVVSAVLGRAGFDDLRPVARQAGPDPGFPTVAAPNPEEPSTFELALDEARRGGADLVLASDPDADRLGVAVPDGDDWRILTGDEIGALLADHVLAVTSGPDRLVVTTFVSSRLLQQLADEAGVHHAETATGFKWIVRPGLERRDQRFVFGYEEALGYSVAEYVRDKDGITAALWFADLVARTRAEGRTVPGLLEDLARRFGLHAGRTWSYRISASPDAETADTLMGRLRAHDPDELAGRTVEAVVDHRCASPPVDAVRYELSDHGRVVVRPSGTEPKLKVHLHTVEPVPSGPSGYATARERSRAALDELQEAMAGRLGLGPV